MKKTVGFDRTIKLEWLQITADLLAQGLAVEEINLELDKALLNQIKGKEARRKVRTVLLAVWVKTDKSKTDFRDDASKFLSDLSYDKRMAVQWGMLMSKYPFFSDTTAIIGRLLNLQETIVSGEVIRRVQELYGERQTVTRATQRLIKSLQEWKVLLETEQKGVFKPAPKTVLDNPGLVTWLVEAFLHTGQIKSCPFSEIFSSPLFFPFDLQYSSPHTLIKSNQRLDIVQQGMDDNLVVLD